MNQAEKVQLLMEIEQEFPVYDLDFEGVKVWPILRGHLAYRILETKKKKTTTKQRENKNKVKTLYNFIKLAGFSVGNNLKLGKVKDQIETLYIVRPNERLEEVQKKRFARFGNSLEYILGDSERFKLLDTIPLVPTNHFPIYGKAYIAFWTYHVSRFFYSFFNKTLLSSEFSKFAVYLEKKGIAYDTVKMKSTLAEVFSYKYVFSKILKKYKPKAVVYACYYAKAMFGLTLACKDLGIKSIEIQHGQQGDFHPMYTHWNNFSEEGSPCLPDNFFMWGQKSVTRIKTWLEENRWHKVIRGGNPWLAYIRENGVESSNEKLKMLQVKTSASRKSILVSCQLIEDFYSGPLIGAIKNSPSDYIWLIRLHPRFMKAKEEIIKHLDQLQCKNYEIELANELPLYSIFSCVDIQITFWSTVAYEALAFDVPTIIIHENGKKGMSEYIAKNIFAYAESPKELLEKIENFSFRKENPEEAYIIADKNLVKSAIENI